MEVFCLLARKVQLRVVSDTIGEIGELKTAPAPILYRRIIHGIKRFRRMDAIKIFHHFLFNIYDLHLYSQSIAMELERPVPYVPSDPNSLAIYHYLLADMQRFQDGRPLLAPKKAIDLIKVPALSSEPDDYLYQLVADELLQIDYDCHFDTIQSEFVRLCKTYSACVFNIQDTRKLSESNIVPLQSNELIDCNIDVMERSTVSLNCEVQCDFEHDVQAYPNTDQSVQLVRDKTVSVVSVACQTDPIDVHRKWNFLKRIPDSNTNWRNSNSVSSACQTDRCYISKPLLCRDDELFHNFNFRGLWDKISSKYRRMLSYPHYRYNMSEVRGLVHALYCAMVRVPARLIRNCIFKMFAASRGVLQTQRPPSE